MPDNNQQTGNTTAPATREEVNNRSAKITVRGQVEKIGNGYLIQGASPGEFYVDTKTFAALGTIPKFNRENDLKIGNIGDSEMTYEPPMLTAPDGTRLVKVKLTSTADTTHFREMVATPNAQTAANFKYSATGKSAPTNVVADVIASTTARSDSAQEAKATIANVVAPAANTPMADHERANLMSGKSSAEHSTAFKEALKNEFEKTNTPAVEAPKPLPEIPGYSLEDRGTHLVAHPDETRIYEPRHDELGNLADRSGRPVVAEFNDGNATKYAVHSPKSEYARHDVSNVQSADAAFQASDAFSKKDNRGKLPEPVQAKLEIVGHDDQITKVTMHGKQAYAHVVASGDLHSDLEAAAKKATAQTGLPAIVNSVSNGTLITKHDGSEAYRGTGTTAQGLADLDKRNGVTLPAPAAQPAQPKPAAQNHANEFERLLQNEPAKPAPTQPSTEFANLMQQEFPAKVAEAPAASNMRKPLERPSFDAEGMPIDHAAQHAAAKPANPTPAKPRSHTSYEYANLSPELRALEGRHSAAMINAEEALFAGNGQAAREHVAEAREVMAEINKIDTPDISTPAGQRRANYLEGRNQNFTRFEAQSRMSDYKDAITRHTDLAQQAREVGNVELADRHAHMAERNIAAFQNAGDSVGIPNVSHDSELFRRNIDKAMGIQPSIAKAPETSTRSTDAPQPEASSHTTNSSELGNTNQPTAISQPSEQVKPAAVAAAAATTANVTSSTIQSAPETQSPTHTSSSDFGTQTQPPQPPAAPIIATTHAPSAHAPEVKTHNMTVSRYGTSLLNFEGKDVEAVKQHLDKNNIPPDSCHIATRTNSQGVDVVTVSTKNPVSIKPEHVQVAEKIHELGRSSLPDDKLPRGVTSTVPAHAHTAPIPAHAEHAHTQAPHNSQSHSANTEKTAGRLGTAIELGAAIKSGDGIAIASSTAQTTLNHLSEKASNLGKSSTASKLNFTAAAVSTGIDAIQKYRETGDAVEAAKAGATSAVKTGGLTLATKFAPKVTEVVVKKTVEVAGKTLGKAALVESAGTAGLIAGGAMGETIATLTGPVGAVGLLAIGETQAAVDRYKAEAEEADKMVADMGKPVAAAAPEAKELRNVNDFTELNRVSMINNKDEEAGKLSDNPELAARGVRNYQDPAWIEQRLADNKNRVETMDNRNFVQKATGMADISKDLATAEHLHAGVQFGQYKKDFEKWKNDPAGTDIDGKALDKGKSFELQGIDRVLAEKQANLQSANSQIADIEKQGTEAAELSNKALGMHRLDPQLVPTLMKAKELKEAYNRNMATNTETRTNLTSEINQLQEKRIAQVKTDTKNTEIGKLADTPEMAPLREAQKNNEQKIAELQNKIATATGRERHDLEGQVAALTQNNKDINTSIHSIKTVAYESQPKTTEAPTQQIATTQPAAPAPATQQPAPAAPAQAAPEQTATTQPQQAAQQSGRAFGERGVPLRPAEPQPQVAATQTAPTQPVQQAQQTPSPPQQVATTQQQPVAPQQPTQAPTQQAPAAPQQVATTQQTPPAQQPPAPQAAPTPAQPQVVQVQQQPAQAPQQQAPQQQPAAPKVTPAQQAVVAATSKAADVQQSLKDAQSTMVDGKANDERAFASLNNAAEKLGVKTKIEIPEGKNISIPSEKSMEFRDRMQEVARISKEERTPEGREKAKQLVENLNTDINSAIKEAEAQGRVGTAVDKEKVQQIAGNITKENAKETFSKLENNGINISDELKQKLASSNFKDVVGQLKNAAKDGIINEKELNMNQIQQNTVASTNQASQSQSAGRA